MNGYSSSVTTDSLAGRPNSSEATSGYLRTGSEGDEANELAAAAAALVNTDGRDGEQLPGPATLDEFAQA